MRVSGELQTPWNVPSGQLYLGFSCLLNGVNVEYVCGTHGVNGASSDSRREGMGELGSPGLTQQEQWLETAAAGCGGRWHRPEVCCAGLAGS